LTEQEAEVLRLVATGLISHEVAGRAAAIQFAIEQEQA
jgi:DNA-binding CsgD family transcriptional regulator